MWAETDPAIDIFDSWLMAQMGVAAGNSAALAGYGPSVKLP